MGARESEEPRPAATVVVVRHGADGPEILVMRRGQRSRFLPGFVVFPGGAVDTNDSEHAARWFGDPEEVSRACAVRELIEEVGLALTARGWRSTSADDDGLAAVDAAPPRAAQLRQISHWIAPEDVPVRFDARFFAVEAPRGVEPRADGGEAVRAWWVRPQELLEDFAAGRCELYWPTFKVTEGLATAGSVAELLALHVSQEEGD